MTVEVDQLGIIKRMIEQLLDLTTRWERLN